ncbi:unnamed protein product [Rotaria sp. Silwood2]|nr:unnamed protein product [Rotaria sp. Silwood2]CAF4343348.1 unnamed protein product [Rotaria sp. Silwood2]
MGIGKSTVANVSFNHSNSFYYAGEKVTGVISFNNIFKKLTLHKVSLEFTGEFGYIEQQLQHCNDGIGHIHTENRTIQHRIPFIHIPLPFTDSKNNENKITLDRGHYSWPFEFTLPEYLPPSSGSSKSSHPYIKYSICLAVNQSWYKLSKKQNYPLTIYPRVDIGNVNEDGQSIVVSHRNRKHLQFKACLSHESVLPGGKFSLDIDLENLKRLKISGIEAILIQHREIAQNNHSEVIFQKDLPIPADFNKTEFHETFDMHIPSGLLPPTYQYMASCDNLSIYTNIQYELKLDVKLHGYLNEMNLSIPIIIGTESSLEQFQPKEDSYYEMSTNNTTVLREMNAPDINEPSTETLTTL